MTATATGNDDDSDDLPDNDVGYQITEQFKQLRRLCKDLQNTFLRWIPIRTRTKEKLDELATNLLEHHKNVNISTVTGESMATLGGILSVAGLIAAPFTFGAGIVVFLVGAGIGGAGGLVMSGSKVAEIILEKSGVKDVQAAIKEDHEACKELQQKLDLMEDFIFQLVQFLNPLHDNAMLLRELEGSGFKFLRDRFFADDIAKSTEERVDIGARFFRAVTSGATISASVVSAAGAVARSAAVAGAHAASIASVLVSAALIPLDITLLVKSSLELHRGSTSKAVEDIRGILNQLECPNEEEIRGLVESFINEKFTEAYNPGRITSWIAMKQERARMMMTEEEHFDDGDVQKDDEKRRGEDKERVFPEESS